MRGGLERGLMKCRRMILRTRGFGLDLIDDVGGWFCRLFLMAADFCGLSSMALVKRD